MSLLKSGLSSSNGSITSSRSAIQDAITPSIRKKVQVSAEGLKRLRSKFLKRNKGKGKERAYDMAPEAEVITEIESLAKAYDMAPEAENLPTADGTSQTVVAEEHVVTHTTSIQDQDISEATLRQRIQSRLPSSCMSSLLPMNMPSNMSIHEDSKLFTLLASTSVMGDALAKGRDSVFAMLDRIVGKGKKDIINESQQGEGDPEVEVSSIMISSPLQPTEETQVEIARSEIVSIDLDREDSDPSISQEPATAERSGLWPFMKKKKNAAKPKVKEVRVWYPSRTKVSLQACWWGYRIYLPPPVMRILSDKSLEAAKRAAMIAAALTWLVSHIPTAMLPLQVRPLVMVAKEMVPMFSYVGGFIAWSWSTVQGFDKGDGVILSATWLLPIALLPGTWFSAESPWESPS